MLLVDLCTYQCYLCFKYMKKTIGCCVIDWICDSLDVVLCVSLMKMLVMCSCRKNYMHEKFVYVVPVNSKKIKNT